VLWSAPTSTSGLADDLLAVKSWCHIVDGNATSDDQLRDMIQDAMRCVETYQRRQLLTATYAVTMDDWPANGVIEIRDKLPIATIVSVQYKDADGDTQTVTATNYHTSLPRNSPARIQPISGYAWPTLQTGALERVTVNLTAGYGNAHQVPMTTRAAIRDLVAEMVENRGPTVTGTIVAEIPGKLKRNLDAECWTISGY